MKKVVKVFQSFAEAEAAEAAYYRSLSPHERMAILLELIRQGEKRDETEPRLEKVGRIVELSKS